MNRNRFHQTDAVAAMIKRKAVYLGCILFLLAMVRPAAAQMKFVPGITTIAGNGTSGSSGDGGLATGALLNTPQGAAYDNAGNLYISDGGVGVVRKIAPNGIITTFAGNGTSGYGGDGGPATSAQLSNPTGIAVDGAGNVYICDTGNSRIRKVDAATGTISTIAGIGGTGAYSGDNGPATAAQLNGPLYMAFNSAGDLYFTDYNSNRVRKITMSSGVITTVAGNGTGATTGDGGLATGASLNGPQGVAIDTAGNLYISEAAGNVVRKIAATTGNISTFAGNGTAGYSGDGGAATSAQLNDPYGLAFDAAVDALLISDANNAVVRMVNLSTGNITTVAGSGGFGYFGDGGPAISAQFSFPEGAVADASGNLVVVDTFNSAVRELTLTNLNFLATKIGSSSATRSLQLETTTTETINSISVPQSQGGQQEYSIGTITGCTVGTSNPANTICNIPITFTPAYPGKRWIPIEVVTSTGNFNFGLRGIGDGPLVALTPGIISTVAGNGTAGYSGDGSSATSAALNRPFYVAADSAGNLYIADFNNNRVRKVDAATGKITTVAGNGTAGYTGDGAAATSAELNGVPRIALDGVGNLYIADYFNARIRKVDAATGIITTVAGNGTAGYTGDGGAATSAELHLPAAVGIDSAGNLYISDSTNNVVRKVAAGTGIITTVVGTGNPAYSGDGGPATSAGLGNPASLAFDAAGNLYIAEYGNQRIRKVAAATGIITTVAGNGTAGYSGDGGAATSAALSSPEGVTVDSAGNLYISDSGNNRVRKVDVAGTITTVAGNSTGGYGGDNGAATSANLNFPTSLALNGVGYLYIADSNNQRIRKVDFSQSALTYPTATTVGTSDSTDNPQKVVVSNTGTASLTIPPPSSGNNPSIPANFTFDSSSTCQQLGSSSTAQTLAAGANCTIAIDFGPNHAGTVTASALLTDTSLNTAATTHTIHLSGTATAASTTTTVAGSPSPSAYSQTVTITATVAPTAGNALPTGSVQFSVDGTNVGSPATLSNGTASFTSSTLAVGSHTLAGAYTPDTSDFTASNGSTSQTVNKATLGQNGLANLTLTSSPSPSAYSQSVTFTATVPSGATGTVQFNDGVTNLGSGTISGTTATLTTNTLSVGTHSVTAAYSGDTNYNSATSAADNHAVNKATLGQNGLANLTLSSSPSPSAYSQSVTFTATVPSGATGTMQFNDGATNLGSGTISGTTATLTTSALAAGTHSVTAIYSGDTNYNTGTSAADNQVVNKATLGQNGVANLTLSSSPSPSAYSQSVTFTAAVPSGATGTVQFNDGATNLGFGTISGTTATLTTSTLATGTHPVTAAYSGDGNYNSASSGADNHVVNKATLGQNGLANLSLTSSPSPSAYRQSVTLTATVPSGATGTVQFNDGATNLGSGTISGTTATLTTSALAVGTHPVTAVYSGDTNYNSAISVADNQVVNQATLGQNGLANLTLTSSPSPSVYGQSITLTATVPSGVTGTVQFNDGATNLGSGTISGTTATLTTSALAVGTHPVTAVYSGDTNYHSATSAADNHVVNKATLGQNGLGNLTLTSSPNPSGYSQSVTFTATVPSGVTGTVQFVDGSAVLGTAAISGTTGSFATSRLAVGTNSVTAVYSGDANYNSATSAADNQVVNGVPTSSTTLSMAPTSVMYGNPATLTAVVAPSFATGTVSFYEGSTLLGTASVDNTGTAVLPISTLNAGVHNITAKYSGDPVVPASTTTGQLIVTQRTSPNGGPAITVTVNNASQTTSANPQFTYSLAGQLANGDTYATVISGGTPTYSTSAGPTPNTYSVSLSGLTSANYTLGFVPGTLTVTSASTTTTLATSPASPQYGDPATLTATVPSGATGSVSFYDGSILLGTGTVSNGTATLTTTTLTAGTHAITAIYNGDATNASSQSGPATVTVAKKTGANGGAALTVTVQNASRQSGAADPQFNYVVTGTLIPGDSYATAVTGSPVYSVADTPGSASGSTFPVNVSGLSSQNYAITVVPGTLNIVSSSTTATLATSTNLTQYGDPITLTDTVAPSGATGTVVFMDGANVLGAGAVSGGVATLTTSSLPAGSYTITATYEGDGTYGASTSAPVTVTVGPKTGPNVGPALTVTVASVRRPYGAGNPAFSYAVSGTLLNADTYATALTGVPVYATTATPTSADGTYPVSILGGLNSNNYSIAFVNAALTVATATPGSGGTASITLTSSPNPAAYGSPVTLTATVPAPATGTVTFYDGSTALGTATVASGIATLTTSTLAVGTHTITAVYSGDANYSSATSAAYSLTVNAVDFTLTLTSAGSQTVIPGNAASYTVQVAPIGTSYPGTVTFSATGLPPGATISFSPNTVAASGGPAPIGVKVQTAAQTAAIEKGRDASVSFALALLSLPFAASKRIRKNSRRFFALLILVLGGIAATAGLTGCGSGNGFFGLAPQTYNITITATSGTIQHSVNTTLIVQ